METLIVMAAVYTEMNNLHYHLNTSNKNVGGPVQGLQQRFHNMRKMKNTDVNIADDTRLRPHRCKRLTASFAQSLIP